MEAPRELSDNSSDRALRQEWTGWPVEIPRPFIVTDCEECSTRHAPIRNCPQVTEDDYDREADYWFWSGDSR